MLPTTLDHDRIYHRRIRDRIHIIYFFKLIIRDKKTKFVKDSACSSKPKRIQIKRLR